MKVAGHELYTVCDGYSGYFQIRIAEEDQKKTTFITPWGYFAYRVMPFGLTNAPATFQRFMNLVFNPIFALLSGCIWMTSVFTALGWSIAVKYA